MNSQEEQTLAKIIIQFIQLYKLSNQINSIDKTTKITNNETVEIKHDPNVFNEVKSFFIDELPYCDFLDIDLPH